VTGPTRLHVIRVGGDLLELQRVLGRLRQRRVALRSLAVRSEPDGSGYRLMIRVRGGSPGRLRAELARLAAIHSHAEVPETFHDDRDDAA
jgi:hypothetical protein